MRTDRTCRWRMRPNPLSDAAFAPQSRAASGRHAHCKGTRCAFTKSQFHGQVMMPNTSVAFRPVYILGAILIAAILGLAGGFVRGQAVTQDGYLLGLERAEAAFYATRKECESCDGEEWKLC